jgi:serine/threonine-protein kinase
MSDAAQGSRVGSQVGHYYLKRLLGRGGMGEVYEAEDTIKERVIALKLLSPLLSQDPVFRERLQREARTAGRLLDPHVVPVHDYGEIDGLLYLDMRLIDGKDLSTLLKESGALTPPRAVAIVRQAAAALDAAHAAGVIHRDIKPENILVTRDDFAYLVDFGIASATTDERLTQAGSAVGTWKYAAPERFIDAEVTHLVDVYALACVLHECLTGAPPYRADSAGMLITAHLMENIPHPSRLRPGIPAAFDEVIARGMAKDPKDRYASAGELAHAANEALSAPDQDRAEDIVERSEEAALPAPAVESPPVPSAPMSAPGSISPQPAGPRHQRSSSETAPPPAHSPPGAGLAPASITHTRADAPPVAPSFTPGGAWPGQFGPPPRISPYRRPPPHRQRSRVVLAAAALVAAVVLVGFVIWLVPSGSTPAKSGAMKSKSSDAEPTASAPATSVFTPPPAESQARLFTLLPAGYPPGICNPITAPPGALAKVSCGQNADPGGPPSATYTLFPDVATLRLALNKIVQTSTVVNCPGRIQSPGPWRHTATPDQISGTLLCGIQQGFPTVVWTNDAELLVGSVQAEPAGPNLDQLYGWWASHS